ncbi:MAG TPA: acyl-CoA dehydrogenase [Tepidisphaeraceae bacterium]|nr:acyl-CoA dehydrogenase [Tepidisphaeraceae bacterium]
MSGATRPDNVDPVPSAADAVYPLAFTGPRRTPAASAYLRDPSTALLASFFEEKGLAALKREDRDEQWYADWIAYQADHRLYATVVSPKEYSSIGAEFDLLRYARFLEVFAYCSPAHGYSLQVSFLGLCAILTGTNAALKREAVAALEAGGLLAFAASERQHGSDLLANEFTVRDAGDGGLVAGGTKYYIGNANAAAMIAVLARREGRAGSRRAPPALFVLRPGAAAGFRSATKIRTLGVRAAFVGAFEIVDHPLPETDLIATGRDAWDAALGAVTLGKFFLGFGSIGICEHALDEATDHLTRRVLYGKPVIDMPHIRSTVARAYARLTAMKLYAYRALDYLHAATEADRRYLLFNAVQKARVSTEGVKVMALLSECVGARGFESDTYFEMALRDAQLIPGLEGSTHINLAMAAQFIPGYFERADPGLSGPASLAGGGGPVGENSYLMAARAVAPETVAFPPYLRAYEPLMSVPNVRLVAGQARAFRLLAGARRSEGRAPDTATAIDLGKCVSAVVYAQLVAENCVRLAVPAPVVSVIFHLIAEDLSTLGLALAAAPGLSAADRFLARRLVVTPRTVEADWEFVAGRVSGGGRA